MTQHSDNMYAYRSTRGARWCVLLKPRATGQQKIILPTDSSLLYWLIRMEIVKLTFTMTSFLLGASTEAEMSIAQNRSNRNRPLDTYCPPYRYFIFIYIPIRQQFKYATWRTNLQFSPEFSRAKTKTTAKQ